MSGETGEQPKPTLEQVKEQFDKRIMPDNYGYGRLNDEGLTLAVMHAKGWEASVAGRNPKYERTENGVTTTVVGGLEALSATQTRVEQDGKITTINVNESQRDGSVSITCKSVEPSVEAYSTPAEATIRFSKTGEVTTEGSKVDGSARGELLNRVLGLSADAQERGQQLQDLRIETSRAIPLVIANSGELLSLKR